MNINIDNCIKAIEIVDRRRNLISRRYHDEDIASDIDKKGKGKKSIISWICYELDRDNYPVTKGEYTGHNLRKNLRELLEIPKDKADAIHDSVDPNEAIEIIKECIKLYAPKVELIKLVNIL